VVERVQIDRGLRLGRVSRENIEHSAVADPLEALGDHRRRAGRRDQRVGAAILREPADQGLDAPVLSGIGVMNAEFVRRANAHVIDVDSDDRSSDALERECGEQPDEAKPDDHDGIVLAGADAAEVPQNAGKGLDHRRVREGQRRGKFEGDMLDVPRGNPDEFGESARIEVRALELAAHGLGSAAAVVAVEAGDVVTDDDAVAFLELRHAFADGVNAAGDFVPERHGAIADGGIDLEKVGAAESARFDAKQ